MRGRPFCVAHWRASSTSTASFRLPDPSELLKIAADHFPDVRIVATGSSTLQATAKFRDSLSGRKEEVWLTPMIESDRASAGGVLEGRLERGGLPSFYLEGGAEHDVQEWLDSYWAKDVQELFRLERRSSFARFVELVLARSGGVFEATAFAGPAEVSRTTVASYLAALEITKVAHVVRPYSTRRSTELVHAPKVYGFDTGFVKTLRGWSECKWRADGREDLGGLKAFRRAYPRGESFVVTSEVQRPFERELLSGVRVRYVGLADLASMVASQASREPRLR